MKKTHIASSLFTGLFLSGLFLAGATVCKGQTPPVSAHPAQPAGQTASQPSRPAGQPAPPAANGAYETKDVLELMEKAFNFGKIPQGRPATHNFIIVNDGTTDLRLENVQASCGCTTPEWSKEPIAPGAQATIKVGYNAYAEGPFVKTVTISYNGRTKSLSISGEVYKAPAGSAPGNESVQLLKQTTL